MIAIMIAGAVSALVSLLGTRFLIVFFQARGQGQPILVEDDRTLGLEHHMPKQGTPTMGGLAIIGAALIGWIVAHVRDLPFSDQAMIVWVGVLAMAAMGFADDWIKVRKRHNRGIFWKQKNYLTMLMSFGMAWWLVASTGISETISLTRAGDLGFDVPQFVWILWAGLLIWATTNAVNVTDGLDGLAGGSALMGFGAFTIIGYWAFRNPDIYEVVNPLDMGVLAAAFAGRMPRLPLVERGSGANLHGRCRGPRYRFGPRLLGADHEYPPPARSHLRDQRCRGRFCRGADGGLQGLRTSSPTLPNVADPSPLRTRRLARDHRDHSLLAARRRLGRLGARDLHR